MRGREQPETHLLGQRTLGPSDVVVARRASPPGPRRALGRGRACAGSRALPRDGNRSGPSRRPDHRRRLDVDADDAVQPQSARARPPCLRRRRRGGRRRARVQHDRRLRQPVAGNAGDAGVTGLARGDRRLDRVDGARARLRRARLPRRLRQDDARRADGAGARRQARGRALQRADARWPSSRSVGDDRRRLGGARRRGARSDHARRAGRARTRRVPGTRHVRRPLHRQHDGGRARVPRARADRRRADLGRRTTTRRAPPPRPRPSSPCGSCATASPPAGSSIAARC